MKGRYRVNIDCGLQTCDRALHGKALCTVNSFHTRPIFLACTGNLSSIQCHSMPTGRHHYSGIYCDFFAEKSDTFKNQLYH